MKNVSSNIKLRLIAIPLILTIFTSGCGILNKGIIGKTKSPISAVQLDKSTPIYDNFDPTNDVVTEMIVKKIVTAVKMEKSNKSLPFESYRALLRVLNDRGINKKDFLKSVTAIIDINKLNSKLDELTYFMGSSTFNEPWNTIPIWDMSANKKYSEYIKRYYESKDKFMSLALTSKGKLEFELLEIKRNFVKEYINFANNMDKVFKGETTLFDEQFNTLPTPVQLIIINDCRNTLHLLSSIEVLTANDYNSAEKRKLVEKLYKKNLEDLLDQCDNKIGLLENGKLNIYQIKI